MSRIIEAEEQTPLDRLVVPGGYRKPTIQDLWVYWPQLVGYVCQKVRDPQRAEDLAQDTLLRAWTHLDSFQPGTKLSAWLYAIAHRLVIDAWRHERLLPQVSLEATMGSVAPSDGDERTLEDVVSEQDQRQRAFLSLPSFQQRTLIQLILHEDSPVKQTSERRMKIHRARAAFWRAYRRLGEEDGDAA